MSEEDIYIGGTSIQIGQHGFINQPKEIIDYIICLQNQLQQKENIIKEVREYIKEQPFEIGCYDSKNKVFYKLDILQILKGEDK